MIRKTDLALISALRDNLAELLPDNFIVNDRNAIDSVASSISVKCKELDFICFLQLTPKAIHVLLPSSLEGVEKSYTQSFKQVEFDYANPKFSIENLAKIILEKGRENDK